MFKSEIKRDQLKSTMWKCVFGSLAIFIANVIIKTDAAFFGDYDSISQSIQSMGFGDVHNQHQQSSNFESFNRDGSRKIGLGGFDVGHSISSDDYESPSNIQTSVSGRSHRRPLQRNGKKKEKSVEHNTENVSVGPTRAARRSKKEREEEKTKERNECIDYMNSLMGEINSSLQFQHCENAKNALDWGSLAVRKKSTDDIKHIPKHESKNGSKNGSKNNPKNEPTVKSDDE